MSVGYGRFVAVAGLAFLFATLSAEAEIQMPTVFGDSMVIQRDHPIHVWGWADVGGPVTVTIDDHSATVEVDPDGRFDVTLPAMPHDNATPHRLIVRQSDHETVLEDVLIGEVYLCSGQSNMSWPVRMSDDADLESLSANFPHMRILSVPNKAARQPQRTFEGSWQAVTPETVKDFSAVGYFFGRQVHQTLGVPVGLIDNAWGGSAAEAWVPRETLQQDPRYADLIAHWDHIEQTHDYDARMAEHRQALERWKTDGRPGRRPKTPDNPLTGNHRIGNLYYGCLTPVIGYAIRGVIWYQGESNASRAEQYRDLFPRMIRKWRSDWEDDFSFYWVQLADYKKQRDQPRGSAWAELREAQTMAMELPHTGQAVIIDLGEARDIHPRDKQNVAKRLARWTFAKDFDLNLPCQSPMFESVTITDGKAVLEFSSVGKGLETFDVDEVRGFTIAGSDYQFVPADATIVDKDTVAVSSETVPDPVAVRYGWADNPVVNLESAEGLPVTPFRTDDQPGITAGRTK